VLITLDYVLVELFCGETLLHKPTIEMPDQPKLNPAVDPRIAVGCQPGCEQIDVSRQRSLSLTIYRARTLKKCLYQVISSRFRIAEETLVGIPVGAALRMPKRYGVSRER